MVLFLLIFAAFLISVRHEDIDSIPNPVSENIQTVTETYGTPDDIIVVNPRKEKVWGVGLNPLTVVTTVMGAIATILGVYLFFDKI